MVAMRACAVKSTTERWILFSVWDGDNGAKTTLVRKAPNVVDNSFGGEGLAVRPFGFQPASRKYL